MDIASIAKSTVELYLKAQNLYYEVKPTRVMVVKDFGRITVDGFTMELQKGTEIELPRWVARILSEDGIAEIVETGIGIEDIARIHFTVVSAKNPAELEPLPKDFYKQVIEYLDGLEKRIRAEFNPALLEEKQRILIYLAEILNKRLTLILTALRSPTAIAELSTKLSDEERILLEILHKVLETWRLNMTPKR